MINKVLIILLLFTIAFSICISDTNDILKTPESKKKTSYVGKTAEKEINRNFGLLENQWFIKSSQKYKEDFIHINFPKVKELQGIRTKAPILVGIIDSGIDVCHRELKDNIFINQIEVPRNNLDDDANGYIDDVSGWDFLNNDHEVFDSPELDNHGTEVAGIIKVIAKEVNFKILPIKVLEKKDSAKPENIIKAIDYAEKMGVQIINCSFESFEDNKELANRLKSYKGIVVCAAGNSSSDLSFIKSYPASYQFPNILSVGSMNNKGFISKFSNYGGSVNIYAPGEEILTTAAGNRYTEAIGTSVSAPIVTGAIILGKSKYPNFLGVDLINKFINTSKMDKKQECRILDISSALGNS